MTVIEDLLAGPRGRRFCWELVVATVTEPSDDDTLFWARHRLDQRRGSGGVLFGPGAAGPHPDPPSAQVVAAYGAVLDAGDPAAVTLDQALAALGRTADSAMWWQEPDADDVLLDTVVPRTLLARAADAAVRSPGLRALSAPPAQEWAVVPDTPGHGGPELPAPELLAAWRRELLVERAHGREDPVDASISGTWWTTPPSGLLETTPDPGGRGPLALWAVEDHTGWERAEVTPVAVDPTARIVTIDDGEDWAALCRRFPFDVSTTTRRHDWWRATARDGHWVVPDWAAVAERYDAVHLTLRGWIRSSGTAIPVDDRTASVIAGWTPGATVWLRDPRPTPGAASTWACTDDRSGWFPT